MGRGKAITITGKPKPKPKPMTAARAAKVLRACAERRLQAIAFDANAWDRIGADYKGAQAASLERKELAAALEVLDRLAGGASPILPVQPAKPEPAKPSPVGESRIVETWLEEEAILSRGAAPIPPVKPAAEPTPEPTPEDFGLLERWLIEEAVDAGVENAGA
jgi:hypothetical protein